MGLPELETGIHTICSIQIKALPQTWVIELTTAVYPLGYQMETRISHAKIGYKVMKNESLIRRSIAHRDMHMMLLSTYRLPKFATSTLTSLASNNGLL